MFKELLDHFRPKTGEKSSIEDSDESAKAAPDSSSLNTDRIKAVISELNNSDALFKESGFMMEKLDVTVGAESKVIPHFKHYHSVTDEEQIAILSRIADNSIIKFVLMSLFRSVKMSSLFDNTEMYFHQVAIDISTSPVVTTTFKREHSSKDTYSVTKH
ncbi:hypothetical protein [Aliikangiella sp. G2MR2-5]|uniref:hypothetical protein n=1 Tax=Aliikangiella sp. G2MR2-5 TaxID=2788943 RepID=UPI0018ABAD49|nr:hypothetical protein [Aliikangiella sp. G2MR2-5]